MQNLFIEKWTTSISQHGHIGWGREDGVITYSVRESMLTHCFPSDSHWKCLHHGFTWLSMPQSSLIQKVKECDAWHPCEGHGSCEHQHWKQWMPCSAILNHTTPWVPTSPLKEKSAGASVRWTDTVTVTKFRTSLDRAVYISIFFQLCTVWLYINDRCRVVWIKFHGQCHGLQSALKNTSALQYCSCEVLSL